MKTVSCISFLATAALAAAAFPAQKIPDARLLDMYAVRDGDSYVVHVLANGDISQFLTDRKQNETTYRLTLDVPALSPVDSKYDVETPFSRSFQVWPMQLGKKIYSRIEIELDLGASSVIGLTNASHLFIRIQRELPPGVLTAEAENPPPPPLPSEPKVADGGFGRPEPGSSLPPAPAGGAPESEQSEIAEAAEPAESELFFSLFPTPAAKEQTLFNVISEDLLPAEEPSFGIRAGRFLLQPYADFSWVRGSNLLLESDGPFVDHAYMGRGRLVATLLDSMHGLRLSYEARYRDFQDFRLEEKFTQLLDLETRLEVTPNTRTEITNHFVRGSFEAQEFDPGAEIVASTDPFYRNLTRGLFAFELSERFGAELSGSYNVVEFLLPSEEFFDYETTSLGGAFLYNLSPLTSLLGEYVRTVTPAPFERPLVGSQADMFLFGVRGELSPMLRGQVRAGYSRQRFDNAAVPQDFTGFVADASLTRDLGERAALSADVGRRTNPSAFGQNGYYLSSYGRVQLISPLARDFRITASTAFFLNDYPVADGSGLLRDDKTLSGSLGLAYFFTPITYLSFDYRHDRRRSNLERFHYQNNAIQLMVGFGFMNR